MGRLFGGLEVKDGLRPACLTEGAAEKVEFFVTLAVAGAKKPIIYQAFSARLKSCPDTKQGFSAACSGVFPVSLWRIMGKPYLSGLSRSI
jgi:hypothetical protein